MSVAAALTVHRWLGSLCKKLSHAAHGCQKAAHIAWCFGLAMLHPGNSQDHSIISGSRDVSIQVAPSHANQIPLSLERGFHMSSPPPLHSPRLYAAPSGRMIRGHGSSSYAGHAWPPLHPPPGRGKGATMCKRALPAHPMQPARPLTPKQPSQPPPAALTAKQPASSATSLLVPKRGLRQPASRAGQPEAPTSCW